jgi:uncharacterized protein (DUF433 family)
MEPDKMAGQPCIRGPRIPVDTEVAIVADGMTTVEILADLPELEAEDVAAALRYAAATWVDVDCRFRLGPLVDGVSRCRGAD